MLRLRGTKKLKELGFVNLEVHKGMWGFSVQDKRWLRQQSTPCRKTQDEAVKDVQNGLFPVKLKEGK